MGGRKWWRSGQVAARFGYSRTKVTQMCEEGEHFANAEVTDGRQWRIPSDDIEAHAEYRQRMTERARGIVRRRRRE